MNSGEHSLVYYYNGPFAPQPVQAFGAMATQYVVTNEFGLFRRVHIARVGRGGHLHGNARRSGHHAAAERLSADDLNAGRTKRFPASSRSALPGATAADQRRSISECRLGGRRDLDRRRHNLCRRRETPCDRDCLDYIKIAADSAGDVNTHPHDQINDVGINGADLFYPAVTLNSTGSLFTVFDESSTTGPDRSSPPTSQSPGPSLSAFQIAPSSSTYYNGAVLFASACDSEGCRWGDYSGAAQDPADPNDVWVVSGSEDGLVEGPCSTINACWNTEIDDAHTRGPDDHFIDAVIRTRRRGTDRHGYGV